MEPTNIDEKYKKLATEYSQLRAKASVLRKAVLEEQNKNATMRESLRVKETNLRRVEQELDSLGFRNKQLEHRVAALQDDLTAANDKKQSKAPKTKAKSNTDASSTAQQHQAFDASVFGEELQKKIFECAQLTSTVADKTAEIQMQSARIDELEQLIRTMSGEHLHTENKLRKEIERLTARMHELETKVTEASSIVGSDDTLYVSECEQHQKAINNCTTHTSSGSGSGHSSIGKHEDRLSMLEKEVVYWQTQYEILQISSKINHDKLPLSLPTATPTPPPPSIDTNKTIEMDDNPKEKALNVAELIRDHYAVKYEDLFMKKCLAESKLAIYLEECDSLQRHLELVNDELKDEQRKCVESQRNLQIVDEDLATTRINYEEQISVLTEQVINLSDQLASLK